jgi:DNA-binding PadR family transcriptional regulator
MKLSPSSYVVLGMLGLGARSGYDVKRAVELSTRFFWTISPVQIYPELRRLEDAGLLQGRDEPRGGRARRVYDVTPAGEAALREWLMAAEELAMEVRDKGLLKLFFADALEPADALAHVRAMRERSERMVRRFREEIEPTAEGVAEGSGRRFPSIAARFGRELNEWIVQWCGDLERELGSASVVDGDGGR